MDLVTTRSIVVDRATILEWPQIEALRRAYFEAREEPIQRRPPEVAWYVARVGERVLGCYSSHDLPNDGQRWIHDFYRVPGREGARAWAAMWADIEHNRDQDGVVVLAAIAPDNLPQIGALAKRAWTITGVVMASMPKER